MCNLGEKKFFFVSSSIFVEMGGWQSRNEIYVMRGGGKCRQMLTENIKICVEINLQIWLPHAKFQNLELIELIIVLTFSRNFPALFQKFHVPARYFHVVKKKLTFCCVGVYFFAIYATFLGKWLFKFIQAIKLLSYCWCDYEYPSYISTKQKRTFRSIQDANMSFSLGRTSTTSHKFQQPVLKKFVLRDRA